MSTSFYLALIASRFEALAAISTGANPDPAGYWLRIATAAESIAGASTAANDYLTGRMKRAAAAVVTDTGYSGTGFNANEEGYIAELVAALEFATSTSSSGSMEKRLYDLALLWAPGPPTLQALTLSANSVNENSAAGVVVGAVQNLTAGSTLSITVTAGSRFALSGNNVVTGTTATDYETATSHSITLRETLVGATNTPRDTVLTINVNDITEVVNDKILFFGDSITVNANSFANLFGIDHPKVNNNLNAIGGTSINSGTNSFMTRQAAGLALNAEALVVLAGANDLSWTAGYPTVTDWMNDLYAFTDPFRTAGTKVYIIPPLPQGTSYPNSATHNTRRATVRTTLLAAVGTKIDGVIDLNATTMGPDSAANDTNLFSDGLHPTDAGHVVIYSVSRLSSRTALGLGTWTPFEWIYSGGAVDGAFFDRSDISTLFKDTAGTLAVTTAADAIARVNDKSGNGYHLLQATAANRPLYQTAGGTGTNPYADFDGVNDNMATASFAAKAQPHYQAVALKLDTPTATSQPTDGILTSNRASIFISGGTPAALYYYAGTSAENSGKTLTNTDKVASASFNAAASFGAIDGVEGTSGLSPGSQSITGITEGSSATPSNWMDGRIYRSVYTFGSIPNSRVRGFMTTWLAAGQGRTL